MPRSRRGRHSRSSPLAMIEAIEPTATPQPGGPPEHDESLVHILGAKILVDWLRNRQQLLVPLTLDLRNSAPQEVSLLMHAMVAAAQADGTLDGKERERVESALAHLHADADQRGMLTSALEQRRPLSAVLAEVPDVQTGARVYAASLLAIDRRKPVNRHYLRYLAARLQLPTELARSLEQRFRAAP